MKSFASPFVLALGLFSSFALADIPGIERDYVIQEVEHYLTDTTGYNAVGIVAAVSPCSNYVGFASDPTNRGEQTSAQWVRFAFHDFVTANKAAGTGGMDASLSFESDRPENHGRFVNDSVQFMSQFQNAYVSLADAMSLAVLVAVTECGGNAKAIPLSVGRIDATQAGPFGVPGPFTPLAPSLAQFAAAGFSASDTIALTSCGHSLGRVHAVNFPEIVSTSLITPTNLDGGVSFDATPAVLDTTGMSAYLDGSTQDPLVISANVSARSDLRLFSSDGNATITDLVQNARQTCPRVFTQMINTVPSNVNLSPPITPMPWKVVNFVMHCSPGGSVRIEGYIRALWTDTQPANRISYTLQASNGNTSTHNSDTASQFGSGLFGNTTYYHFVIGTDTSPGTTGMTFQGYNYPINDKIFVLPTESTVKADAKTIEVKAAVLTSSVTGGLGAVTGTLYVPVDQPGTLAKAITQITVPMSAISTNGNYTVYDGKVSVPTVSGVVAKVQVGDISSFTIKTSLFNGGV